ncbi:hypothetical protein [Thermoanaerobacter thermocopriae]|uniref:hypothetical protein n=1 Tax=Thermoanaerobacter thermocopriae TaxID=29350 RepID=UPI0006D2234A|nr:hypothetical protein [Thermoanaerobacter thermocopriae]
MHSTIFQLEEKPLRFEEDFVCEEDFYDDFVGIVANYVSEDVDREEEINYFVKYLGQYGIIYNSEEQSIVFPEGFKAEYFSERFFKLKNCRGYHN